jgi:hypothetical protein
MPPGDSTPGDVSVDVLNLLNGVITNYATLSVSNILSGSGISYFTVYGGQTLAPLGVGTIGTLKINGDLNSDGTLDMDISKVDGVISSDTIALDWSGGFGRGVAGEVFRKTPPSRWATDSSWSTPHSCLIRWATVILPTLGPGLGWTNNFSVDGTIRSDCVWRTHDASNPVGRSRCDQLYIVVAPCLYEYSLGGQTNPVTIGLTTNWARVNGGGGKPDHDPGEPGQRHGLFSTHQGAVDGRAGPRWTPPRSSGGIFSCTMVQESQARGERYASDV